MNIHKFLDELVHLNRELRRLGWRYESEPVSVAVSAPIIFITGFVQPLQLVGAGGEADAPEAESKLLPGLDSDEELAVAAEEETCREFEACDAMRSFFAFRSFNARRACHK